MFLKNLSHPQKESPHKTQILFKIYKFYVKRY